MATSTDLDLSGFYADSVASGLVVTQDTLLDGDISAGTVYINQALVSVDAVVGNAFTASKDTYVDVGDDAVITYTETVIDAGAPALAADAVRIAKVVTDGTEITSVVDMSTPTTYTFVFGEVSIGAGSTMDLYNPNNRDVMVRHGSGSTSVGVPLKGGETMTVAETVYVKPTGPANAGVGGGTLVVTV